MNTSLPRNDAQSSPPPASDAHWLVVIDHHEARIYRSEMQGTVPQQIQSHATHRHSSRTQNSGDFGRGREPSSPAAFFAPVAAALHDTGKILVFGSGKGTSSEMVQFIAWAKDHQPALAARIIGTVVIDQHHTTPAQLLAKAREFYSTVPPSLLK